MSDSTPASTQRFCTGCGVALTPGVRFCSACGTPLGGGVPMSSVGAVQSQARTGSPVPWIVAGLLTVVAVAAVIYSATDRTEPPAAGVTIGANGATAAPTGQAPDISNMTPREQFTRLSDRVTEASEKGDTATVLRFTPMALGAYANLPPGDRDIDARYHMAMIQSQVGMFAEASALADTIFTEAPNNLMGHFIKAIVADFQGDKAKAEAARAEYRKQYDTELAKKRDEYQAHLALLEAFKNAQAPK